MLFDTDPVTSQKITTEVFAPYSSENVVSSGDGKTITFDIKISSANEDHVLLFDKIAVLVHHDPSGVLYVNIPDLPGCITQATSFELLQKNVKDAIDSYLISFDDDEEGKPCYQIGKYIPEYIFVID